MDDIVRWLLKADKYSCVFSSNNSMVDMWMLL